jgi:lipid II isoglutaminyl synthase (glutamine-hydrolysing)
MRRSVAVAAAKVAAGVSRRLKLGGGTALPGLVAERIDPGIVAGMASRLGQGSVLVTGTNGKTTTARLLRNIVEAAGFVPVANRAGSNMMRGVAAALAETARWDGSFSRRKRRLGIFEVDEATLPIVAAAVKPRAILFTNLFRDQLDRYGEVEHVADVWRETVRGLPQDVALALNADDPSVAYLRHEAKGPLFLYGLQDRSPAEKSLEHAADARWCASCGSELEYRAVFYGHLGHWRCPQCKEARPRVKVSAREIEAGEDHVSFAIKAPAGEIDVRLPLAGLYNVYNAVAATAAASALGIGREAIEDGLRSFKAAFGRQERLKVAGRDVQLILAKNPAGLNQVLRTITVDGAQKDVVLFLNDGIADGRDISWIWDVDFELLDGSMRAITVSGVRAWDMALRLKYAGLEPMQTVEPDTRQALRRALKGTPEGQTLYVIPTYTAMLEVRNLLGKWAGRGAFWEER